MTISLKPVQQDAPLAQPPHRKKRLRRFLVPFLGLALVALVFFACYWGFQKVEQSLAGQTSGNQQEVVGAVGKLMLLPQNETPTVAVVSDLGKLQGQPFFANAEQGDVVLMYAQADKAILYSPSLNKIIEVAPITNQQQQ